MTSLSELASRLKTKQLAFIAQKGNDFFESNDKGISPVMQILDDDPSFLDGASVADKIVGKAAALLFIKGNIKEIYALTISRPAVVCFEAYKIPVFYDKIVSNIINRAGTDICPMEKSVIGITDPEEAYIALQKTIKSMSKA